MKNIKKIFSLMVAFVMMFGLALTTVHAEGSETPTTTITIENAVAGKTYNAYKLFDAIYNEATGSTFYTWPANSQWKTAIESNSENPSTELITLKTAYDAVFTTDTNENIKENDNVQDAQVKAFVNAAKAYAEKENIQPTKTAIGASSGVTTITDVEYGYYFVTTTAGSLITLNTLVPDAKIVEKNDYVPVDKTAESGQENKGVGDTVNFTITAGPFEPLKNTDSTQEGYKNIVITDIMTDGLDPNTDITVTFKDEDNTEKTLTPTTDYTLVGFTEVTDSNDANFGKYKMTITIPTRDNFDPTGGIITVTYSAVINENAITTDNTNQSNKVKLEYGNNSSTDSEKEVVIYRPADLEIFKYTVLKDQTTETALAGAKFTVKEGSPATAKVFVQKETVVKDSEGKVTSTTYEYRPVIANEKLPNSPTVTTDDDNNTTTVTYTSNVTELISGTDGMIHLSGLAAGTYTLEEIKAPDGYNRLTGTQSFTISPASTANGTVAAKTLASFTSTTTGFSKGEGDQIKVVNTTGAQLPSTGGSGTTMMYIAGGALLVGAVVLLITRKRVSE